MHFNGSNNSDNDDLEDMTTTAECPDNETSTKKAKYDPFAGFRNMFLVPLKVLAMYQILKLILTLNPNITTL